MNNDGNLVPQRRRRHSAEFKMQVIKTCRQPGVSVAATALRYGLNANMLRLWIRNHERAMVGGERLAPPASVAEFVPLKLSLPVEPAVTSDIVIEVKRGTSTVTVRWPGSAAMECASWLQHWLR